MKLACVYDVIHPYVIGGVQKRNWEIGRRLARKGHEVTLFGMKHWEGNSVTYNEGVRLWGVCPPQQLFRDGHRSMKEVLSFAYKVLRPLMREKYDIVEVANFPYFPCFAAQLHSLVRRSRLIITWHEVWGDYWYEYLGKKGVLGKAVEGLVARLPHRAIAVSPHTRTGLEGLGRKGADIVPNGVDIPTIEDSPRRPKSNDIIFVGRLTREKNVIQLVKAVNILKESGHNPSCLIVGDGPDRESLEREVARIGVAPHIRFLGRLMTDTEVYSSMKASRALVQPSLREGFSHVVLEANACGIPVVTVNHPLNAAQDLIIEGQNGLICDLSADDMAQKILKVLENSCGWEERCKGIAKAYDWDIIADLAERAYLKD